jgi:SAM-dependent methyltransferase
VDVGAGTGKLTRQLVARDLHVTAVEPVEGMRNVLRRVLQGVDVVEGTAEAIPVADGGADAVTVAQAFHWFDAERALAEFHRVLRRDGVVALIWNVRDRTHPLHQAYAELIKPYRGGTYPEMEEPGHALGASPRFHGFEERRFPYVQFLDADGLVERASSVSFIAQLPSDERDALLDRVRALAPEGEFEFPYVTKVFTARSR